MEYFEQFHNMVSWWLMMSMSHHSGSMFSSDEVWRFIINIKAIRTISFNWFEGPSVKNTDHFFLVDNSLYGKEPNSLALEHSLNSKRRTYSTFLCTHIHRYTIFITNCSIYLSCNKIFSTFQKFKTFVRQHDKWKDNSTYLWFMGLVWYVYDNEFRIVSPKTWSQDRGS